MFIDPALYSGAPEDLSGREAAEVRSYELLATLGIPFFRCDHDHADTIEACETVEAVLGAEICKNLFLTNRQQTELYLLLMPGRKAFKTKYLSAQLGTARLSFAPGERMESAIGCPPGSASLLGLMNDAAGHVRLIIDREVWEGEWLGCHPCRNTSTLRLAMTDVRDKLIPALGHEPTVVELPREEPASV